MQFLNLKFKFWHKWTSKTSVNSLRCQQFKHSHLLCFWKYQLLCSQVISCGISSHGYQVFFLSPISSCSLLQCISNFIYCCIWFYVCTMVHSYIHGKNWWLLPLDIHLCMGHSHNGIWNQFFTSLLITILTHLLCYVLYFESR